MVEQEVPREKTQLTEKMERKQKIVIIILNKNLKVSQVLIATIKAKFQLKEDMMMTFISPMFKLTLIFKRRRDIRQKSWGTGNPENRLYSKNGTF